MWARTEGHCWDWAGAATQHERCASCFGAGRLAFEGCIEQLVSTGKQRRGGIIRSTPVGRRRLWRLPTEMPKQLPTMPIAYFARPARRVVLYPIKLIDPTIYARPCGPRLRGQQGLSCVIGSVSLLWWGSPHLVGEGDVRWAPKVFASSLPLAFVVALSERLGLSACWAFLERVVPWWGHGARTPSVASEL